MFLVAKHPKKMNELLMVVEFLVDLRLNLQGSFNGINFQSVVCCVSSCVNLWKIGFYN